MEMVVCPHCGTRVVLTGDRACPSCRKKADDPAAMPVASGLAHATGGTSAGRTDFNPYQAPRAALSGPTDEAGAANRPGAVGGRTFKFYSPGQVAGATFLGTPMAGFWLLASNHRSLGERFQANRTLLLGVTITMIVFAFSVAEHSKVPNTFIPFAYTWLIYQIAKQEQGKSYNEHISLGGRKHSNWRVVGMSLMIVLTALLVASFVAVLIGILVGPEAWIEE